MKIKYRFEVPEDHSRIIDELVRRSCKNLKPENILERGLLLLYKLDNFAGNGRQIVIKNSEGEELGIAFDPYIEPDIQK